MIRKPAPILAAVFSTPCRTGGVGEYAVEVTAPATAKATTEATAKSNRQNTDATDFTEPTRISQQRFWLICGGFGAIRGLRVLAGAVSWCR